MGFGTFLSELNEDGITEGCKGSNDRTNLRNLMSDTEDGKQIKVYMMHQQR
jgi:hypothetical protein